MMDAAIRKAEEKLSFISNEKEATNAYQMREMALSDWTSGINYARREGKQAGIREGIHEQTGFIAKTMKKSGEPVDRIMKYTGLTKSQIAEL
ncbi:MAG: hypothetical protein LBH18_05295 [Spirochaetaceae bacterium]|jgi:predicted transposase/invertase (TIGR01784 family)|nr:hypothetical protein [Spirochaetaceae bacterium]